jgi:hypothetical protein
MTRQATAPREPRRPTKRRPLIGLLRAVARVATTLGLRMLHRSDHARWTNAERLELWWDSRTAKLAHSISPGARVIDFGAGRRQLERLLDPTCTYFPLDLTDRGPGTIVCDLNDRPLPDLRYLKADVVVFGGVLEYIRDLTSLIHWLASQAPVCVASYEPATHRGGLRHRLANILQRSYFGYMNHYDEPQLLETFRTNGFVCIRTDQWNDQRLFVFETQRSAGARKASHSE